MSVPENFKAELALYQATTKGEPKNFHFVTGLPRSGSTLLCNILNQNPRFHASATSGVQRLLANVRDEWNKIVEFGAVRNESAKLRVLRSILQSFYADIDKPIIFDKHRVWPAKFEMVNALLGQPAKMLVTVRDIRDVLASFERLWREESASGQTNKERDFQTEYLTAPGRVNVLMKPNQTVGKSYNIIKDALFRGHGKYMYFVVYEELTQNPDEVMRGVYDFLGQDWYAHDFKNVEQAMKEDDFFYGYQNLHATRSEVKPVASYWHELLGPFVEHMGELNFWKTSGIVPALGNESLFPRR